MVLWLLPDNTCKTRWIKDQTSQAETKLHKQMKWIPHSQLLYSTNNKISGPNIDMVTKIAIKENMTYQNPIQ